MTSNPLSETETYVSLLNKRRDEVRGVLHGLSAEALNWLPLPKYQGETRLCYSIYQLAYHSIVTEVDWRRHIAYRLGRITWEAEQAGYEIGEQEVVGEDIAPLLARLEEDGQATNRFILGLSDDDLGVTWKNSRGDPRSARWIIGHVIAHYGEHIGQMILTRRLWEHYQGR
jgi:uncharacterized damage-inducible protein DinB